MSAEAWPTEAAATRAVDVAAKKAYDEGVKQRREVFPPSATFPEWEDLPALEKLPVRQAVLPIVWAALEALPDPRFAVYEEGYAAGRVHSTAGNPYPSGI